jgi:hypothetical protein
MGERRHRTRAAIALLIPLAGLAAVSPHSAAATPMTWRLGAIVGGGFQNVVTIDPGHPAHVATGGDVAGVSVSMNDGQTFAPYRNGVVSNDQLQVAALTYDPAGSGTLYACTGIQGVGGGFLVRPPGGVWQLRSTSTHCSGNGESVPGLPGFPRSTGNLIAITPAASGRPQAIYVGTFRDGLMLSVNGGSSWSTLGLAGQYIRGLALDQTTADVVYAAVYGHGVYRISSARTTPVVQLMAGSPTTPEELTVVHGVLYAVAGNQGVFKESGGIWTKLGLPAGPNWISIAALATGPTTAEIYVGNLNAVNSSSAYKSKDNGVSWSPAMTTSSVRNKMGGTGGPWWLLSARKQYWPGASHFSASNIQIDPQHPNTVFVAGRSGIWRTTDGGTTWYPMVAGLEATVSMAVATDPTTTGRVYIGNMDYTLFSSSNNFASLQHFPPPSDTVGFSVAVDPSTTPGIVVLGTGNRDANINGEVFTNPNPLGSGKWTAQGLKAATGGNRPLGVIERSVSGHRILLAAVEATDAEGGASGVGGIWRKQDSGPWQHVQGLPTLMNQSLPLANEPVPFTWPSATGPVYVLDRHTGLWSSTDAGATWHEVWSVTSPAPDSGYLASAPSGTVYVSVNGGSAIGVYALSGGSGTPTRLGTLPGAIAIAVAPNGVLWAAAMPAVGRPLFIGTWTGGAWQNHANGIAIESAGNVNGLAVDKSGHVTVVFGGDGSITG